MVKKVSAYPFAADLERGSLKRSVQVQKLTHEGVIVHLPKALVNVGEHYKITFSLPVSGQVITADILVVKTFDKSIDPKVLKVERMAELRFLSLTEAHRNSIFSFLTAIGQRN